MTGGTIKQAHFAVSFGEQRRHDRLCLQSGDNCSTLGRIQLKVRHTAGGLWGKTATLGV